MRTLHRRRGQPVVRKWFVLLGFVIRYPAGGRERDSVFEDVADSLLGGQSRALGPRGFKVLLTHCISQRRHRGFVADIPDIRAILNNFMRNPRNAATLVTTGHMNPGKP